MPVRNGFRIFVPFCTVSSIAVLSYVLWRFWRLKTVNETCTNIQDTDEPSETDETMNNKGKEEASQNDCSREDVYCPVDAISDERKVFVSNINFQVRTGELKDFFSYFGRVTQVNLLRDRNRKRSRGLAFVTFSKRKEAENAKTASDYNLTLDGRVMKCSAVQRRSSRKGPKDKTEQSSTNENPAEVSTHLFTDGPPSLQEGPDDSICTDDSFCNTLPDDILIKIFSYLTLKERISIESVCRRWRKVCLAAWRSQSSLHFTNVFKGFSFSNEHSGPSVLTDAIFKSILFKGCYNLKQLDISASPRFLTPRSLNCIGQVCRELRVLDLSRSKVDNTSIKTITNGTRKIERIILKECQDLGEKGIWWLFHNCENLYHVDLRENRRVNGKCFHILNKHCKTVLLDGCCSINDKGLDCLTAKCGDSLQELDLSSCTLVTDKALNNMVERCKSLQILKMCGIHSNVSAAGLSSLVHLPLLDTLHLTYQQCLNDAVLLDIAHHCMRLRELRIDGCSFQTITDSGVKALAHCPCLEVLNISYHGKVTDEGIKHLAFAGRLQKLIARSLHITDQAIRYLAAHCFRLCDLDVCGCTALTIDSIQTFLEARKVMVEQTTPLLLNFGGTTITKESLSELGDIDPNVTVSLQNFNAPPGQYYPTAPYDDRPTESSNESDDDDDAEEEDLHINPLDDDRPVLNLAAHLNFQANRQRDAVPIEYLQVPADSDEPWDGIVNPQPAGCPGPVASGPGESGNQDVPWDENSERVVNFHRDDAPYRENEQAAEEQSSESVHEISYGDLNPQPSCGEVARPPQPGHFAHANPELAEFVDVEEHLMAGDLRRGGDWMIAEEDVNDFLDADDPAYMNDVMFLS